MRVACLSLALVLSIGGGPAGAAVHMKMDSFSTNIQTVPTPLAEVVVPLNRPHLAAVLGQFPRLVDRTPYQVGIASWYGADFQGLETSSGVPFNMYALTAAHRSLPFGTRVRVTNLKNMRSVVVVVNDRGPVPRSRIIDLSFAAAQRLNFKADGLEPVRLDLLPAKLAAEPRG